MYTIVTDGNELRLSSGAVEALFRDLNKTARIPVELKARFCNDVIASISPEEQRELQDEICEVTDTEEGSPLRIVLRGCEVSAA